MTMHRLPIDSDTSIEVTEALGSIDFYKPTIHELSFVSQHDAQEIDIEWPLTSLIENPTFEKVATDVGVWRLSGRSQTGTKGTTTLSMNMKLPVSLDDQRPLGVSLGESNQFYRWVGIGNSPYFLATPMAESPTFLTTNIAVVPIDPEGGSFVDGPSNIPKPVTPLNVEVTVISWGPDGKKVGNVQFNWMCVCKALDVRYRPPFSIPPQESEDTPVITERKPKIPDPGPY